jgi:hypothetical protein
MSERLALVFHSPRVGRSVLGARAVAVVGAASRIGDLAHCKEHRTTRQNDDRRTPEIKQAPTRALAVRKHARRLADSATPRTGGLGQSGHVGIISGCTVIAAGWHEFPCEDPPGPGVCATRRSLAASAGRVGSTT